MEKNRLTFKQWIYKLSHLLAISSITADKDSTPHYQKQTQIDKPPVKIYRTYSMRDRMAEYFYKDDPEKKFLFKQQWTIHFSKMPYKFFVNIARSRFLQKSLITVGSIAGAAFIGEFIVGLREQNLKKLHDVREEIKNQQKEVEIYTNNYLDDLQSMEGNPLDWLYLNPNLAKKYENNDKKFNSILYKNEIYERKVKNLGITFFLFSIARSEKRVILNELNEINLHLKVLSNINKAFINIHNRIPFDYEVVSPAEKYIKKSLTILEILSKDQTNFISNIKDINKYNNNFLGIIRTYNKNYAKALENFDCILGEDKEISKVLGLESKTDSCYLHEPLDPTDPIVRANRARLLYEIANKMETNKNEQNRRNANNIIDSALKDLDLAIRSSPHSSYILGMQALCLHFKGQHAMNEEVGRLYLNEALDRYNAALDKEPTNTLLLRYRGALYRTMFYYHYGPQSLDKALDDFNKAQSLNPHLSPSGSHIRTLVDLCKFNEAKKIYEIANMKILYTKTIGKETSQVYLNKGGRELEEARKYIAEVEEKVNKTKFKKWYNWHGCSCPTDPTFFKLTENKTRTERQENLNIEGEGIIANKIL